MLDAYIIEQIRKREEERRRILDRPAIELPLHPEGPPDADHDDSEREKEAPRVVIIDI